MRPTGIAPLAPVLEPLELAIDNATDDDIETALDRDDVLLIGTLEETALGTEDDNDALVMGTPPVFLVCRGDPLPVPIPDPPPTAAAAAAAAEPPVCDDALLIETLLRGDAEAPPQAPRELDAPP